MAVRLLPKQATRVRFPLPAHLTLVFSKRYNDSIKYKQHMALTKKDLKQIKDVVVEATEPYFTAIKADFNNMDDRFDRIDDRFDRIELDLEEVKDRLSRLERRVIALEGIATEHGKELRKIRKALIQMQKQRKVDAEKLNLLEKRIVQLETAIA